MQLGIENTAMPSNRAANIFVAHHFIATGVKSLQESDKVKPNSKKPEPELWLTLLGKASVGMTCLAQGFELCLAAIVQAEKISLGKKSQHSLIKPFRAIYNQSDKLQVNIDAIVKGDNGDLPVNIANEVISLLEQNFFVARYFGVDQDRRHLNIVNHLHAAQLSMALALTYPRILRPAELAPTIGFKTSSSR